MTPVLIAGIILVAVASVAILAAEFRYRKLIEAECLKIYSSFDLHHAAKLHLIIDQTATNELSKQVFNVTDGFNNIKFKIVLKETNWFSTRWGVIKSHNEFELASISVGKFVFGCSDYIYFSKTETAAPTAANSAVTASSSSINNYQNFHSGFSSPVSSPYLDASLLFNKTGREELGNYELLQKTSDLDISRFTESRKLFKIVMNFSNLSQCGESVFKVCKHSKISYAWKSNGYLERRFEPDSKNINTEIERIALFRKLSHHEYVVLFNEERIDPLTILTSLFLNIRKRNL